MCVHQTRMQHARFQRVKNGWRRLGNERNRTRSSMRTSVFVHVLWVCQREARLDDPLSGPAGGRKIDAWLARKEPRLGGAAHVEQQAGSLVDEALSFVSSLARTGGDQVGARRVAHELAHDARVGAAKARLERQPQAGFVAPILLRADKVHKVHRLGQSLVPTAGL